MAFTQRSDMRVFTVLVGEFAPGVIEKMQRALADGTPMEIRSLPQATVDVGAAPIAFSVLIQMGAVPADDEGLEDGGPMPA